jgi:hypothetical protein
MVRLFHIGVAVAMFTACSNGLSAYNLQGDVSAEASGPHVSRDVGGLVLLNYLEVPCKECFGFSDTVTLELSAWFHSSVSGSWFDRISPMGECVVDFEPEGMDVDYWSAGKEVALSSESGSYELSREGDGTYTWNGDGYDLASGDAFDLFSAGGSDLGSLLLTDVLEVPDDFDVLNPEGTLRTGLDAFSSPIQTQGQDFRWTGSTDGSFRVKLVIFSEDAATLLGTVSCHARDTGSLVVPGGILASFPANSLVGISMSRFDFRHSARLPDGSTLESVAEVSVWGTGYLVR